MRLKSKTLRLSAPWLAVVVLAIELAGCRGFSGFHRPPLGIDGVRCVGRVQVPRLARSEVSDAALIKEALGITGKGGVCAAKVLVVQKEMRVYRVWDSSRAWSAYGRWWSLERPEGTRESYREEFAVCPAWSALDHLISCTIKPGTEIVIGPTQSAECAVGTYPKTPRNQIYVRNDSSKGQLLVENCQDEGLWPAPPKGK